MPLRTSIRTIVAGVTALAVMYAPAYGLVTLNDGKDRIFLSGNVGWSWDSNVFANSESGGDYVMSSSLTAEYSRRAGIIGVDASAAVNIAKFNKFTAEDFANPSLSVEFTKQTGRTTGSLSLRAERESRADSAANIRNESWHYGSELNYRYPVIERYSLSGNVVYSRRDFQNNEALVDLDSIGASLDLFYVYTSERDLFGGYRFRRERSSAETTNVDNSVTIGISGKILPKLNGSLRGGWQMRRSNDAQTGVETFNSWTAGMAATWLVAKRLTTTANVSKDFSTTSTNISTDTLSMSLDGSYSATAHWALSGGFSYGQSSFLGAIGEGRVDDFFKFSITINYTLNQYLKVTAGYTHFMNTSTSSIADYARDGYSVSVSSRW